MSVSCEIHFQEGFAGESVTVAVDGKQRAKFVVRTRLQTGLARMEAVKVDPGQVVSIEVPSLSAREEFRVGPKDHWLSVNLVSNSLQVRSEPSMPGYL